MGTSFEKLALLYTDQAYKERDRVQEQSHLKLMGRHVAGMEFLDSYLQVGTWRELTFLLMNAGVADSVVDMWKRQTKGRPAGGRLRLSRMDSFHQGFLRRPTAPVLHLPVPPDSQLAWARSHANPAGFCITGLTHTICSEVIIQSMRQYVTDPFEEYDALICISRAALEVTRKITGTYADYLAERHGGKPRSRIRLVQIPLGVNPRKYRPTTSAERASARADLEVTEDELVILFVGRLSYHSKVHPYPMFAGAAEAARRTGKKVHLILSGWAPNASTLQAFQEGASSLAPGIRVSIVDGTAPDLRYRVWHAADIATSLTDNIQETFSQVVVEGMACGLPVVATDWDGCRDQVVDGECGYLVPTRIVRDSTRDLTSKLLTGEVTYDRFLGLCNQTVVVDKVAAADAFERLILDGDLRKRMGEAGRRRVLERFTWERVIGEYEQLWSELDMVRREHLALRRGPPSTLRGPACYPAPEDSFRSYPAAIVESSSRIQSTRDAEERLPALLSLRITSYAREGRVHDARILRDVIAAARSPIPLEGLDAVFTRNGIGAIPGRATVGWMMKYDLLREVLDPPAAGGS